mgnify:CR=1 FL=1
MKKLLSILSIMTLSAMLFAQAPQSFSYQTVIRDANWQPISNQSVSIKIEIIEDAVNGFVVHEESHSATTNDIGLVNLAIGSVVTQGSQFQNINWSQHTHFIRVSVDVSGGLNYIVMGTTQLRSVPYALYAETSGSMLPGPQGIAGNDGVDGTNGTNGIDGNDGAPGVDGINGIDGLPGADGQDGVDGINGTNGQDGAPGIQGVAGATGNPGTNGVNGTNGTNGAQGLPGNDGIDGQDGAPGQDGSVGATGSQGIQGVPGNDGQDGNDGAQGVDGTNGTNGLPGADGTNGVDGADGIDGAQGPIGLPGSDGADGTDGIDGTNGVDGTNGADGIDAVVDYDSLANIISVDSTFITNVGGGMGGGGCDYLFPDGINGITVSEEILANTSYIVPSGKRLYLLTWNQNEPAVNGLALAFAYGTGPHPIIIKSGESLSVSPSGVSSNFTGFLVDNNIAVDPITQDLSQLNPYNVPTGKRLYVLSWRSSDPTIDGVVHYMRSGVPLILNANQSLSTSDNSNPSAISHFNGYLVDENYFAGCGGGGSSSATSSLDSTTIANMIAAAGGGVSFGDFISINTNTESQAISDGFLYGKFHLTNVSTIDIFCDTFSGNTSSRGYFSSNPYGGNYLRDGSFNIPIKKNEYYSFNNTGNSSIYDAYFVPLDSDGGSSSNSGPTFIDPILITSTLCGYGSSLNDSIHINVDSILGQNISSLIIHSEFLGPIPSDQTLINIDLELSSWNGIFNTPVFNLSSQQNYLGYAVNVTSVSNQVTIPNSSTGQITFVIDGHILYNGNQACSVVSGDIKIVGYY